MTFNVTANPTNRLGGLRRFAIAITVFNILGHTVFGFEQAWIQPLVSILTAYACEIWFELVDCYAHARKPRFSGGWRNMVDFLLVGAYHRRCLRHASLFQCKPACQLCLPRRRPFAPRRWCA